MHYNLIKVMNKFTSSSNCVDVLNTDKKLSYSISKINLEQSSKTTQYSKNNVTAKEYKSTQTVNNFDNYNNNATELEKYDKKKLYEFLDKTAKYIINALKENDKIDTIYLSKFNNTNNNANNYTDINIISKLKLSLIDTNTNSLNQGENISLKPILISSICFQKNVVAVGYFYDDHLSPCSHLTKLILIINYNGLSNSSKTKKYNNYNLTNNLLNTKNVCSIINLKNVRKTIEMNCCISCIESSKLSNKMNCYFLIGTYLGDILIVNYNFVYDKASILLNCTSNLHKFHKERIVCFNYLEDQDKFISLSSDSILYIWSYNKVKLDEFEEELCKINSDTKELKSSLNMEVDKFNENKNDSDNEYGSFDNFNNDNNKENMQVDIEPFLSPIFASNLRFKVAKTKNLVQVNSSCTAYIENINLKNSLNNRPFYLAIACYDGSILRAKIDLTMNKINNNLFIANKNNVFWSNDVKNLFMSIKNDEAIKLKDTVEKYLNLKDLNNRENYNLKEVNFKTLNNYNIDLTKYYNNTIEFNYEKCYSSINCISSNIFNKTYFLTVSKDGYLRIFNNSGKFINLSILEKNEMYTYAIFSLFESNIIIAGSNLGYIYIYYYEIKDNKLIKIKKVENNYKISVTFIKEERVNKDVYNELIDIINDRNYNNDKNKFSNIINIKEDKYLLHVIYFDGIIETLELHI